MTYSPFCSTIFCHFSDNFTILSSEKLLSFEQRTFPGAFYSLPGNWTFFPLTEFCKEWNKRTSEGAMSGEYDGWIRTSQLSCNSFCLVIRGTCSFAVSWWKVVHFLLTNSIRFSSSAAFRWSNWEQYSLELIVWLSGRGC